MTAVASDVSSVKTDVGGVKTDLAKTQSDLANAVAQLTSMKGDLSDHSSLIARNAQELEVLQHKGDRNYYEFTLSKGQKKPVGTVSLELKKADSKKSRFTLVVYADDRSYEKKDRNVDEPLQFYSGKEPALYEIVVNAIAQRTRFRGIFRRRRAHRRRLREIRASPERIFKSRGGWRFHREDATLQRTQMVTRIPKLP